jgi:hypothetical protein
MPRSLLSRPSAVSWVTIVLTLFGASRSSCAASATDSPGRRAVSRSSSDRARGSDWAYGEWRTARRATRRMAPSAVSSSTASALARSSAAPELTSFTELTICERRGRAKAPRATALEAHPVLVALVGGVALREVRGLGALDGQVGRGAEWA